MHTADCIYGINIESENWQIGYGAIPARPPLFWKAAVGMLVKLDLLIKFMAVKGKIVILTGLV